jgi:hypothetical protein
MTASIVYEKDGEMQNQYENRESSSPTHQP